MTNGMDGLLHDARALLPDVTQLRRTLHRQPEVGLRLPRTQETILTALDGLGLQVSSGREVDSVVAVLEGTRPGATVLLRGDMDALPLQEDTGLEFASTSPGLMHACGHDTHVAMLTGAARLLAARREAIAGRVLFMFQPGEEGYHGARYMLAEGLLGVAGDQPVSAAYALHISTRYPTGSLNLRPGPLLASSDVLRITVRGAGGHAAAPHQALDPIPIACEIAQAIHTMVTRTVDIFDPAVVTIAQIVAGTTDNIIPETARLLGTIRTLSARTRDAVRARLAQLATGIASAHGASADVDIEHGYPVTVNDAAAAEAVRETAVELVGPAATTTMHSPIMGAEDFSYVLEQVPGAMAFLGACPPGLDPEFAPANHSNRVVFDEEAMSVGVAAYTALALRHVGPAPADAARPGELA